MGTPLLPIIANAGFSSFTILVLYPAVLRSGAQNIITNRDIRRSNSLDKYKGVGQQRIIKY